jgi:hypothetical protein
LSKDWQLLRGNWGTCKTCAQGAAEAAVNMMGLSGATESHAPSKLRRIEFFRNLLLDRFPWLNR